MSALKFEVKKLGGVGSGNWNHQGRPGQTGGTGLGRVRRKVPKYKVVAKLGGPGSGRITGIGNRRGRLGNPSRSRSRPRGTRRPGSLRFPTFEVKEA